jgi:hypothetical protein
VEENIHKCNKLNGTIKGQFGKIMSLEMQLRTLIVLSEAAIVNASETWGLQHTAIRRQKRLR